MPGSNESMVRLQASGGVELDAFEASAETHVYEAGHAFANDARAGFYVRDAAQTARARTVAFLRKVHAK